jgi:hypothetical protein
MLEGRRKAEEERKGSSSNVSTLSEPSSWEKFKNSATAPSQARAKAIPLKEVLISPLQEPVAVPAGKKWSEIVKGKQEGHGHGQGHGHEQEEQKDLVEKFEQITLEPVKLIPLKAFFELLNKKCKKIDLTDEEEKLLSENCKRLRENKFSELCDALTEFMKEEPRRLKLSQLVELKFKVISKIFPNVSPDFEEKYYSEHPSSSLHRFLSENLGYPSSALQWIVYFTRDDLLATINLFNNDNNAAIQCHISAMLMPYLLKDLISEEEYQGYEKDLPAIFREAVPPPAPPPSEIHIIHIPIPTYAPRYYGHLHAQIDDDPSMLPAHKPFARKPY